MHSSEKFTWIGRKDFIINSGGVKINPEDIEKKLTKFYSNRLVVSSMNDKLLGQKVVLVFEKKIPKNHEEFFIHLKQFEKPKEIFLVDKFPITNGKINRLSIHKLINKSS
jgi:O-succinylbenzoic acid--CoA ligase